MKDRNRMAAVFLDGLESLAREIENDEELSVASLAALQVLGTELPLEGYPAEGKFPPLTWEEEPAVEEETRDEGVPSERKDSLEKRKADDACPSGVAETWRRRPYYDPLTQQPSRRLFFDPGMVLFR